MRAKDDCATDHLVGIDGQVEAIMDMFDYDFGRARCLGIHGAGGVGKTTLAKALFDKLISNFDQYCFLRDVSGSSRRDGLVFLQNKLLSDVLGKNEHCFPINDIDDGMKVIREKLHDKKVLIVLNDVDHREQLEKLIGKISCFGAGSRVVITTRNKSILESGEKIILYELKEMNADQALQLYINHAFKGESPRDDYYDRLSRDVVSTIGGLPLTVKVIGSFLHTKYETVWKDTLEKLRSIAHEDVRRKLKISYDALNIKQKQIFLDIACLPFHKEEINASYMWEDCDVFPRKEIEVLSSLSLINIGENGRLWMHDVLKDLGRQIVHEENLDPGKRSRLWIAEEAVDVVKTRENKGNIEALSLAGDPTLLIFTDEDFSRLPNLRFLELDGANFIGDFTNLFSKLRWFSWFHCPPDLMATNLFPQNLVVLQLSGFNDANTWAETSQIKMLHNLKVLELTCLDLNIIDLSGCFTLERLIIKECRCLVRIRSIGELKQLAFLNIEECHQLKDLPGEIGQLVKLRHLSLSRCSKLRELPSSIGELKSLIELDLSYTSIKELPRSVGHLANLESLSLAGCREIGEPTHWTGNLESLIELDLSFMRIKEVPSAIGKLSCLRILDLSESAVRRVPETIAALTHLEELILKNCNMLQVLPSLPSSLTHLLVSSLSLESIPDLSNLTNLVDLVLSNSFDHPSMSLSSLFEVCNLEWIGNLSKLVNLELCFPNIIMSPSSLGSLSCLKKLSMSGLQAPEFLMEPPKSAMQGNLSRITTFPDLCNLRNLISLKLCRSRYKEIQLGGLEKLRDLTVDDFPVLERIVFSQSGLKNLKEFELRECPILREIHGLGGLEALESLKVELCPSIRSLNDLSTLQKLMELRIKRCHSLEYWTNALDTVIPDECQIVIDGCPKVGETPWDGMCYKDYRDKFLGQIKSHIDVSTSDTLDEGKEIKKSIPCLTNIRDPIKEKLMTRHVAGEKRRRLSIDEVKALEKNFEVENKLEPERKMKLAQELGLRPRQVAVWFQNRLARRKREQLERQRGMLKANYEALKLNHEAFKHKIESLREEWDDDDEDDDMLEFMDMWSDEEDEEVILLKEDKENEDDDDEKAEEKVAETEEERQVAGIKKFVGTDDQVNQILSLMNINEKDKRIVVVIHGESGIGKTTLAKLIYNQVSCDFDGSSFVADIKETTQVLGGLQLLQVKLISDVLKRELEDVAFVNREIEFFRDLFCDMRVLIILDDVENAFHFQKLIGNCFDCFASGSRILVTTRNSVVLEESPRIRTYHVSRLDNDQTLHLFRQHASMPTSSSHNDVKLSSDALNGMAGLPLFIKVMSAFFHGETQEQWNKLLSCPLPPFRHWDLGRMLKDIYRTLDKKQEQIFLDIACFTAGMDGRIAWYLWYDTPFLPSHEILTPLASTGESNQIWMHSMLRRLGREIVHAGSLTDPGRRSRLFNHEIALHTIKQKKGTKRVQALCLNFRWNASDKLTPEDFKSMPNLRFLQLDHADIAGDFANVFPNLRWLRWRGCPRHLQVTNFHLGNLTILDLSWSKITKDWEGWDQIEMKNLRVLDLTGCADLLVTPKFSGCKNLTILILERCSQLVKIDHSIGDLKCLVSLNLKFCTELIMLPAEVGHLTALQELIMDGTSVQEIPISIGHLKQLETLSASNCCSLSQLPRTICHLTNLSLLSLDGTRIAALPDSIGELVRLKRLSLRDCRRIRKLPNSIGNIGRSLVELDVSGAGILKFPDSLKHLQGLKVLRMDSCFFIEFPPDIGELTSVEEIHASWCRSLDGGIPSEIGKLHNLRILRLRHSSISSIPAEIHQLSNLRTLDLLHCDMIKQLPTLPSSITALYVDDELKSSHLQ